MSHRRFSPKNEQTDFFFFAFLLFTAKKTNLVIRFLGESTAYKSAYGIIWPLEGTKPENSGLMQPYTFQVPAMKNHVAS